MNITKAVSKSDKCKVTKDGILFDTMLDLKYFVDEILAESIQKSMVDQLNRKRFDKS